MGAPTDMTFATLSLDKGSTSTRRHHKHVSIHASELMTYGRVRVTLVPVSTVVLAMVCECCHVSSGASLLAVWVLHRHCPSSCGLHTIIYTRAHWL